MTRNEIREQLSRSLEDQGLIHFTNDDLNDSLQDGYDLIALSSLCVERITSLTFVANRVYYDFATLISNFYSLTAIFNTRTNRWIEIKPYGWLATCGDNWETLHGETQFAAPVGISTIAFHPTIQESAGEFVVLYKAQAPILGDTSQPEFHPEKHSILLDYSFADLMHQNLEYAKANLKFAKFLAELNTVKQFIMLKDQPARRFALLCQYLTTPTSSL